jgi:adenylate kinase
LVEFNLEELKKAVRGKKILLLGLKGSGKGNRSQDLKALGLIHVGLGNILRAGISEDPDSELSQKIVETTREGMLLPDDVVIPVVSERLSQSDVQEHGFVLEGFPRSKAQADWLLSRFRLDLVLLLDVPKAFLIDGIVRFNRRSCVQCATNYSDFDPPRKEGVCDKCGGRVVDRKDENVEALEARLKSDEAQLNSFLPDLEAKGIVEVLPITVADEEMVEAKYLKKLRGEVYRVQTDIGSRARMLNYDGMRRRLYALLAEKFL